MPHYSYSHTFIADGSRDNEEELEMPCHWGILTDVLITFAPGCHGVVFVHLDESLHQIYPTNPEDAYSGDGYTIEIRDEYELLPATRRIYLRGWNTGVYPHTIRVAFRIKMPERLSTTEKLLDRMVTLWESITGFKTEGE